MSQTATHPPRPLRVVLPLVALAATAAAAGGWWFVTRGGPGLPAPDHAPPPAADQTSNQASNQDADQAGEPADAQTGPPGTVRLPKASWVGAGLEVRPAARAPLAEAVTLTGKIALNEDRIAHIYPLVDGRVASVAVGLGDRVTKGQPMAVIQSREVGEAMLRLVQDRLQLGFARTKAEWTKSVFDNATALIGMIKAETPVDDIETQLRGRPLGEYRDRLMSAYIAHATSRKNLDRLTPLSQQGVVAARQVFEAEASWTTDRATLQSLLEQIEQDARQAALAATQSVRELETRVAVAETALEILGFAKESLADIDPASGEKLSHCPVYAPFDGTVISKDVVLLEHVGETNQILGIADLSTVWVAADVYEEQLPLLEALGDRTLRFHAAAWPGRTFEAKIFYTGDIVDPETRTVSMRAVATNAEGLLKPGMFVTVEMPAAAGDVLQVPLGAVLEHEGQPFVFVKTGDDLFARRDVKLGRKSGAAVEVLSGIAAGDEVVTAGGFALKSRLLADLLAE